MKSAGTIFAAVAFCAAAVSVSAGNPAVQDAGKDNVKAEIRNHLQNHFKFYGFVRNYFAYDNRESIAGTGDLFYWLPKDRSLNALGEDLNAKNQFRYLSLTTRVGVDVSGYKLGITEFGGKIEADFYAGLTGVGGTAQLRLRQAFATLKWAGLGQDGKFSASLKIGQAWHPMAADLPDIFSLESGAPFNPFNRSPQVTADVNFCDWFSVTASLLWQMQYQSTGPKGASADYIKYSCTPETYLGVNFKTGGFLMRVGVDILSIRPRVSDEVLRPVGELKIPAFVESKVKDRISTASPFVYLQYTKDKFKLKAKTVYGSAGEHLNLMSGYAITDKSEDNSLWTYTPLHSSSSWLTLSYGKEVQGALLVGYFRNLGTSKDIYNGAASSVYFQKNGSFDINRMFRIQPEITWNIGKFTVGLEYMLTGVQYGADKNGTKTCSPRALVTDDLHWIVNHRVQAMVKFTF